MIRVKDSPFSHFIFGIALDVRKPIFFSSRKETMGVKTKRDKDTNGQRSERVSSDEGGLPSVTP